jgi:simple sugar transport system ATP-binding protein/ribose transport system ATP-binding protein
MTADFVIQTRALSKRFFAVQALESVEIAVRQGDIHALVGENGAGKSTLGKIISGIIRPDAGDLIVKGRAVAYASPRDALLDGITTITQEISLSGKQTALQNLLLGQEDARGGVLDFRRMQARYDDIRRLTGFDIDPQARVGMLRMADQKKVEVMQAIARNAQVIIMDEPTAMLSGEETALFLKTVRHLKSMGLTIIYVSHFLREVLDLADTVTIMRNGQVVRSAPTHDETVETLVTTMLGKTVAQMYPHKTPPPDDAPVALEIRDLQSSVFRGVSLTIRAGEILGLAGLVGSGRSRLARTIFGAEDISGGSIRVGGAVVVPRSPHDAIRAKLYMLPESRKEQGLLLKQSVQLNITLPHLAGVSHLGGVIDGRRELRGIGDLIKELDVRVSSPATRIRNLSGGNQQKALFGKWLFKRPKVLIIDEPTRGIDVGAKQAIYELIARLAREGMAILMISSEIEEVLGLCHRVLVMRRGQIVTQLYEQDGTLTEDNIMRAAFGTEAAQQVDG